jgi:DNA-binding transcriptional LysR family regulator
VSGALSRLRDIYQDPLLVRVGRSSELSPRALKLKEKVEPVCLDLEDLFEDKAFDPKTDEYHFVIAVPDYLAFFISVNLIEKIHKESLSVKLHFQNVSVELSDRFKDHSIDLAVCGDFGLWSDELCSEKVFDDETVAVVSSNHPLLQKSCVSKKDLLDYPGIHFDASCFSRSDSIYRTQNTNYSLVDWDPDMQVSSGQVVDQLHVCAATESIARLPKSTYLYFKRMLPIASLNVEGESTPYETKMFWSQEQDQSEANQWLRNEIKGALDKLDY